MSNVEIIKCKSDTFGNCVKLTNGIAELMVTLDFGPRIIHFSLCGKENMFYNDLEKKPLGEKLDIYQGEQMKLYGGHRIWLSPEILPRCYYPDNSPVTYETTENGIIVSGPVEKFTNIQKTMNITMFPGVPDVNIDHTIINCGVWDIELSVWCITMMDKGGKAIIPMPARNTELLPNRNISLWDYSEMNDERIYWGKDFITLAQDSNIDKPFKLGLNNEAGWGAYFNKGQVFFKFFEPVLNGVYPDNGCSYEAYTNNTMLEIESLSEVELIAPGDCLSYAEEWEIYEADIIPSNDENEIRDAVNKYVYK